MDWLLYTKHQFFYWLIVEAASRQGRDSFVFAGDTGKAGRE
jgi:hypothetical protein